MNINDIARESILNPKWYAQSTATEALDDIIKRLSGTMPEDQLLQLAVPIYRKIAPRPSTSKKPTGLARFSPFAAKKDTRYYLNCIYITEDSIVASDGATLLFGSNAGEYEPGYYDPKVRLLLHDRHWAIYPDFKRLFATPSKIIDISDGSKIKHDGELITIEYGGMQFNQLYIERVKKALGGLPDTAKASDLGLMFEKDGFIAFVGRLNT